MRNISDEMAVLDMRNNETIGRISNSRLNPPVVDDTIEIVDEPRKCDDCDCILAEDYPGDICPKCSWIAQNK